MRSDSWRRVGGGHEHAILDRTDKISVLGAGHALDLLPFLISHEPGPRRSLRRLVRPREEIHELGSPLGPRLPHGDDLKAVRPHDPRRVIAEPIVKGRLAGLEDLVDAQLMDHVRLSARGTSPPSARSLPDRSRTWRTDSGDRPTRRRRWCRCA